MKVEGQSRVGSAAPGRASARSAAGDFSIAGQSGAGETAAAAPAASASALSSLDALIALQQVENPLERRRKAVRRASAILDVLDEVKLALLDGGATPASLDKLMQAIRQEHHPIKHRCRPVLFQGNAHQLEWTYAQPLVT